MDFFSVVQTLKTQLKKRSTLFLPRCELELKRGSCFFLEIDFSKPVVQIRQCDYPSCQSTHLLKVTLGKKDVLCAAKGFHVNKGHNHVLTIYQIFLSFYRKRKELDQSFKLQLQ